jgi:FkbM family methyltransferase
LTYAEGTEFILRPDPFADRGIAWEVMFARQYDLPPEIDVASVRRVVDLGANVGYSCLFWVKYCPNCLVEAFEPHPEHVRLVREHLRMNSVENRVKVIEAAAGTANMEATLSDRSASSAIIAGPPVAGTFQVKVLDFFETVGTAPIDVLKIDIEGGEYPILEDRRFAELPVRFLVMELHRHPRFPNPREWCEKRLREVGYRILPESDSESRLLHALGLNHTA